MFKATAFLSGVVWVTILAMIIGYLIMIHTTVWIHIFVWLGIGVVALIVIGAMRSWITNLIMTVVIIGVAWLGYQYLANPSFFQMAAPSLPWWSGYTACLIIGLAIGLWVGKHRGA